MKKLDVKKSALMLGERVARESVGKSCPLFCYEPKVPDSLKKQGK